MANEATGSEAAAALDPLEEVLQQVAEQTLRVNNLDATVKEVAQGMSDLGEAVQAGLLEVRNLVVHAPVASGAGSDDWRRQLGERLDELEGALGRTARRQALLGVLLVIQLVISALVAAELTGLIAKAGAPEVPTFAPPAMSSSAPAASPIPGVPPLEPASPPPSPSPAPKARKRRAH